MTAQRRNHGPKAGRDQDDKSRDAEGVDGVGNVDGYVLLTSHVGRLQTS